MTGEDLFSAIPEIACGFCASCMYVGVSRMFSRLVLNGLELSCLLLTHLTYQYIFHEDVYIVSTCCLIGVCYVRWLKGRVNPLGNYQFLVSLCNTKCLNNYLHCFCSTICL